MRRIAVAGVILVVAFLLGRRVHLDEDVARLLPDTSPDLSRATLVMRRLLERAVVDLEAMDGTSPEELGRAADRLTRELTESGAVGAVRSRLGEGDALALVDLLRDRRRRSDIAGAMSDLGVAAATPEILTRLADLLGDEDADFRESAASTVRELGEAAATPGILARLAGLLRDEHALVRQRAADAMGCLGKTAATPEASG